MNTQEPKWIVVDTPMRPNRWKVVQEGRYSPGGSSSNNSFTEYFPSEDLAGVEADKRNAADVGCVCPWCKSSLPLRPQDYESCPECKNSFSFATPAAIGDVDVAVVNCHICQSTSGLRYQPVREELKGNVRILLKVKCLKCNICGPTAELPGLANEAWNAAQALHNKAHELEKQIKAARGVTVQAINDCIPPLAKKLVDWVTCIDTRGLTNEDRVLHFTQEIHEYMRHLYRSHNAPDVKQSGLDLQGQGEIVDLWLSTVDERNLNEAKLILDAVKITVESCRRTSQTLTCVYCGQAYPPGTPAHGSAVLTEHIKMCAKHPMNEMLTKLKALFVKLQDQANTVLTIDSNDSTRRMGVREGIQFAASELRPIIYPSPSDGSRDDLPWFLRRARHA
jgi:hypothetical protein